MTSGRGDVLLTGVPDHERSFAALHFPSAVHARERLSAELARDHPGVRALAVMVHDVVEPHVLDLFDALEVVVTRSDGYDHLPLDHLRDRKVPGYHLAGYATASVAEHTVGLILSLMRRVPEALTHTRGRRPEWDRSSLVGRGLAEVTVGVLGVGRIGSAVARHLTAMGATVRGFDLVTDDAMADVDGFAYVDALDDLVTSSDVLTVHLPLTAETRGIVARDLLSRLPDGALLVNTARGALLDQDAVARALDTGRLAGYATDVLPGEPRPPSLRQWASDPRVLVTPHLAAYDAPTIEARYAMTARIVEAVLAGQQSVVAELCVTS